jgi:hypothetical protein
MKLTVKTTMKKNDISLTIFFLFIFFASCGSLSGQSKGLKTISKKELKYHLEFLGAREFRGRETPSAELDIATLYLANWSRNAGLKTIMPDGSYYQYVPLTVTKVLKTETRLTISGQNGEKIFYYGQALGGNFSVSGSYSGEVVLAGTGISDPENNQDDLKDPDIKGKVVIILDTPLKGHKNPEGRYYFTRLNSIISALRDRGAAAVLSVVSPEREEKLEAGFNIFDKLPSGRLGIVFDSQRTDFNAEPPKSKESSRPLLPFEQAEISHDAAAAILGVTAEDISGMFRKIRNGEQIQTGEVKGVRVRLDVSVITEKSTSRNVIAVIEGSDPVLKDEYVVICGHPDGLGLREGEVLAGADDNGTATVALIEIAQALMTERPKRSVIIGWFTGEEKMMNGSHFFINNSPVPVEKISACLNMDMLGRNNTDSLFLVCSDLLSTELDGSIKNVNEKSGIRFGLDYRYSSINHPEQVYFRSDHYPFVRFGIPSVWFFSGFTPDYHTPKDVTEFINYEKFFKITRLVYLTAFDIGNKKELLKLDVNPKVTSRGKHNLTEPSLFRYTGR